MAAASYALTVGSLWFFGLLASSLQDYLVDGDGRSWIRAYRCASIPAGAGLALAALTAAMAVRGRAYVLGGIAITLIGGAALLIAFACIYGP